MKICVLSCFDDVMAKDTGGAVRIYSIAKFLSSFGHEVHIVMPGAKTIKQNTDGMVIHQMNGITPVVALKSFSSLFGFLRSTFLYFYDFLFVLKICKKVCVDGFDLVQIEQPWAGGLFIPLITKVFKKPLIVDSHDVFQTLRMRARSRASL